MTSQRALARLLAQLPAGSVIELTVGSAAGMCDSKMPDMQAGYEKGVTAGISAMTGINMMYESAGMHASLMGTSFESYVLDNDLLGAILRTVKGIEVNDDTLNFDVIRDTVMGAGHYLGHPQTFARMKTDYVYPVLADRRSANEWQQAGARDVRDAAREHVKKILSSHYPQHIAPAIDAKIRAHYNIILPRHRMQAGNGAW